MQTEVPVLIKYTKLQNLNFFFFGQSFFKLVSTKCLANHELVLFSSNKRSLSFLLKTQITVSCSSLLTSVFIQHLFLILAF